MKYGAIALVGKPNVGKSTILNQIFHENLAIVNNKPQTTRNQIAKIFLNDDFKILFVDTPGFHEEKNELDKFLNGEIYRALKLTPIVFVISDLTRNFNEEDVKIAQKLAVLKDKKFVLIFNKSDLANNVEIAKNTLKEQWEKYLQFNYEFVVNQCTFSIDEILKTIVKDLEDQEDFINFVELNLDDRFLIKETIRNVLLKLFRQEIPYSLAVQILENRYELNKNTLTIKADIYVNKESQKPILIGKNGRMIKEIGVQSRLALAQIYACNINLFLNVKVKVNWKDNVNDLKDLGYVIRK